MTIIPLNKVTIFGMPADKPAVLEGLQRLGCLHLIPLQTSAKTSEFATTAPGSAARQALRYIMDVPRQRHQVTDESAFDLDRVVTEALANKQKRRETEDKKLFLVNRLDELEPWGDFTLPNLEELGGYRLWFYRVPHPKVDSFREALKKEVSLPWQLVYESGRNAYFVLIAQEEPQHLPIKRTHAGAISPQELKRQLQQAEIELDEITAAQESLSRWIFLLSKYLSRAEDTAVLQQASYMTKEEDSIFLVKGWLPKRDLKRLAAFTEAQNLAFLAEAPTPEDNPPTLMENPVALAGGQDLVSFYETPGYRDWDPSITVFFSFSIFFAMIICDAGYALVLGLILAYGWRSLGKSAGGRNFRILSIVGLVFALIYGILAGSYFGIEPPPNSLLGYLQILNLNNYDEMMKLSISVGCLHIMLANGVVAYRGVGIAGKAKPLGWIAVTCGGLLMYLSGSGAVLFHLGVGLGVGGLLAILLLSSDRPLNSPQSLLLRLFEGLSSLVKISQLFGDVMSYLRLFALGLASASLALTFNQLAEQVGQAIPTLGLPIAILILLLGHSINLLLAIISGFVHGLRLNFIEFFNWSLSEEGTPFQAFAKKETIS